MFVQWVRLARILGRVLAEEGINFLYYFGSMTKDQRNKAVETFQDDPNAKVMVSSRPRLGSLINACTNEMPPDRVPQMRRPSLEPHGQQQSYQRGRIVVFCS